MKKLVILLTILLTLLFCPATFAEIVLNGPSKAEVGELVRIEISGLTASNIERAEAFAEPEALLIPAMTWNGEPFLLFSSEEEGTFTLTVSLNSWTKAISGTVKEFEEHKIPVLEYKTQYNELVNSLKEFNKEITETYPPESGEHVVIVGSGETDLEKFIEQTIREKVSLSDEEIKRDKSIIVENAEEVAQLCRESGNPVSEEFIAEPDKALTAFYEKNNNDLSNYSKWRVFFEELALFLTENREIKTIFQVAEVLEEIADGL